MVNIKLLMERANVSCQDISDSLNVSQQAVYKWIDGKSMPRGKLLPALADLLHCSIDELYGREAVGSDQTAS